jgi:hypothetical protein
MLLNAQHIRGREEFMRRILMALAVAVFAVALGTFALGQANPDQNSMDPQQLQLLLRQVQMQMRRGNFNSANLLQQLQQQGLINAEQTAELRTYLDQMQADMLQQQQARASNSLQGVLNATDEEWSVLNPRIQRVVELTTDLGINNSGINIRLNQMGPASLARNELYMLLSDPGTTEDQIAAKLGAYRAACQKVRTDLAGARTDLVNVLTLRQESILINMQVIE